MGKKITTRRAGSALAVLIAIALSTSACSGTSPEQVEANAPAPTTTEPAPEQTTTAREESATLKARLAVTYDGGIKVYDAATLAEVADIRAAGFLRLNDTGTGRHLAVSGPQGFSTLDLGTWAEAHGDHSHYYVQEPSLSDVVLEAGAPGHVINHAGLVAFFDDASGTTTAFEPSEFGDGDPEFTYTAAAPHHGLTVPMGSERIVTTEGTSDERNTVKVATIDGETLAETNECPNVHGEATAADDIVSVGCGDGTVIVNGTDITKVKSPDVDGRIGTQSGSHASHIVLGDYKTEAEAESGEVKRVSLLDTVSKSLKIVELPASYTFRSFARDIDGTPLVLGTDGAIHVLDIESGTVATSIPVIPAWEVPEDWQAPRPTIFALDGSIYVTSPDEKKIYAVDIETERVWKEAEIDVVPNELSGVSGQAADSEDADHGHDHSEDEGDDHDHDHDHDHADDNE